MEQGDRTVLQLATGGALGMDVGDLLQLQGAFEGNGVAQAAAEVHEVGVPAVLVGNLRDLLLTFHQLTNLVRQRPQDGHELAPPLQRDATVGRRQAKAEQEEADHVGGQCFCRCDADLRSRVEIDGAVRVARR